MTASSNTTTTTTRLHITPFTPDLLPSVLPASLQSTATDVSFHNLPTFPENSYGYVTLPAMEAEKIKKKLNGSILKGKKFKVDTARPEQKKRELEPNETEDVTERSPKKKKSSKKSKAAEDDAVLDGYELPSDRKVKRGWTESTDAKEERRKDEKRKRKDEKKAAKSQAKSKYTEKDECLFRTQVPPNKDSATDEKQDKKSKKKNKSKELVAHEFANTVSHPSFLRSGPEGTAPTSAFEQEKGWVDGSGNVKEPANDRAKKSDYRPGKVAGAKEKRKSKSKEQKPAVKEESAEESEDWTSSSGSSDDSDSDSDDCASTSDKASDDGQTKARKEPSPSNTTNITPNTDVTANQDENESSTTRDGQQQQSSSHEVHPLEAIFKRSAPSGNKPAEEANPHFSFLGNNDDIESDDEEEPSETVEPQTPFTKQDIQARGLRSAAPTPDTGLVGRTAKWSGSDDSMVDGDDDDEEESVNTPVPTKEGVDQAETEFAKWFWENRGDNNRAWKKRRREVAKEERQRENRRKGMKGKS